MVIRQMGPDRIFDSDGRVRWVSDGQIAPRGRATRKHHPKGPFGVVRSISKRNRAMLA